MRQRMHTRQTYRIGSVTHTIDIIPAGEDPHAYLENAMKDCPDCQAALARGEQPTVGTGDLLDLMRPRGLDRFRRPRWRELKRRVRR
jgi:hypothetical protein